MVSELSISFPLFTPPPRWSLCGRYASYWNAFLFDEIVEKVCTENETQKQSGNEEDNKSSSLDYSKVINSLGEFLSVLDQQKAFLK